jgi:alpha-L-fucosidase 2
MLDRYDFTQDQQFARDTLVPLADPLIAFLDQYWQKRDANGKIILEPAQSLETWHVAVNPLPEVAGLRFLLPRLLALPKNISTEAQRSRWARILQELPPVPAADVGGVKLLQPADKFSACANSENPELYAVFPYRLYGVGRPDLALARATYERRTNRHNRGWCQDSIQAACLGLGDEAGRLVAARAANINHGSRFPAFWGPNFDWIPDQDHGANILTTLQCMLLQSDGRKLYLLPAWPKNWDVSFKLHAPYNTAVEGIFKAGKLEKLKVTPESRAKDVVNMLGKYEEYHK